MLLQAWLQGMNPQTVQFLVVRIRRGHVLEDALNQIATRADELKKPLRIIFSSGIGAIWPFVPLPSAPRRATVQAQAGTIWWSDGS